MSKIFRVIANYVIWRVIFGLMSYMPKKYRNRQIEFSSLVSGRISRVPVWRECLDKTEGR